MVTASRGLRVATRPGHPGLAAVAAVRSRSAGPTRGVLSWTFGGVLVSRLRIAWVDTAIRTSGMVAAKLARTSSLGFSACRAKGGCVAVATQISRRF